MVVVGGVYMAAAFVVLGRFARAATRTRGGRGRCDYALFRLLRPLAQLCPARTGIGPLVRLGQGTVSGFRRTVCSLRGCHGVISPGAQARGSLAYGAHRGAPGIIGCRLGLLFCRRRRAWPGRGCSGRGSARGSAGPASALGGGAHRNADQRRMVCGNALSRGRTKAGLHFGHYPDLCRGGGSGCLANYHSAVGDERF